MTRPSKRGQRSGRTHDAQGQEGPDDASNKEFALRTISLLAKTHEGNGLLEGQAIDDEEQLAAAFSFLQMQAAEYLNLQMETHGEQAADHPRTRVAAYAIKMIKDIIEETGHPVHRLFRGLNKRQPPGDVTSRNFTKQSFLIACVEALLDTTEGKGQSRSWAMKRMRENAELKPYVPEEDPFKSLLSRKSGMKPDGSPKDPLMRRAVKKHLTFLKTHVPPTVGNITTWTARTVGVGEKPMSLQAASQYEPRGQLSLHRDGKGFSFTPPAAVMNRLACQPRSIEHPQSPERVLSPAPRSSDQT
ncbi:MAG: hypothetical protein INR71_08845 [Terriglobus roseus]|nr:hypothetical protein [Terriglobus roseus]